MSKKQPTQDELAAKVFVGNFGEDGQQNILEYKDGDKLILGPGQVTPYDKNPRRVRNREYESIREQLRFQGLQEVMHVTQRPGMPPDQFMPARGFNTRLQIVKEFFGDGDTRFGEIECRYVAWVSEAKTFTNHLAENEVRGEVLFFDRATSVMTLKEILEQETGNPIGPTDLIDYLTEQGIQKITRADIARFEYTAQHLQEALATALSLGLGPWQVDAIANIHEAGARLWEDGGETDDWDPLFQGILRKLDRRLQQLDDWSHKALLQEVARELGGNETREMERSLARLEFVLETGELPEKQDYQPITSRKPEPGGGSQTSGGKSVGHVEQGVPAGERLAGGESQAKDKTTAVPAGAHEAGRDGAGGPVLDLEENEEDPDDDRIDLETDSLLRDLMPDPGLAALGETDEPLLEREDGLLHHNPVDHDPFKPTEGALASNMAALESWRKERESNPPEPLTPEQQELFERRQAWEAKLVRNRSEAGRSRGTTMRLRRLMENLKDIPLESLHHHGYASALRLARFYDLDDALRPINNGIGFYLRDLPPLENLGDDSQQGENALIRVMAWWWLLTVSGQIQFHQAAHLPQEILDSPLGKLMQTAADGDGLYHFHAILKVFKQRIPLDPLLPILHEMLAVTELNDCVDQAILARVLTEAKRRSRQQAGDNWTLFNHPSRWDREYTDEWIDKNDSM